jgi:hypothetical protein
MNSQLKNCKEHIICSLQKMPKGRQVICDRCKCPATYGIQGQLNPLRCKKCTDKDGNKDNLIYWKNRNRVKCQHSGCLITAFYSINGTNIPTHCTKHGGKNCTDTRKSRTCQKCKEKGACYTLIDSDIPIYCANCVHYFDVNKYYRINSQKCKGKDNCETIPTFAIPGCSTPEYCAKHKPVNAIDAIHAKCLFCNTIANYGDENGKDAKYCAMHRPANYSDKSSVSKCSSPDCKSKSSSYYDPKNEKLKYCTKCGKSKLLIQRIKKCEFENCTNKAAYRKIGTKLKKFCRTHGNIPGYERYYRKCDIDGCVERGTYISSDNGAIICSKHRKDDDEPKNKPYCKSPNCKTHGTFGDPNDEKRKLYCKQHKQNNHIRLKGPKCCFENCSISPSFMEKSTELLFCKLHSENKQVTVLRSRKCINDLCDEVALYGILGSKPVRCKKHIIENDRYRPTKQCNSVACKELATHGLTIYSLSHCAAHATDNEIDLVQKKCIKCNLIDIVDQNGICKYHDDTAIKRNYLQKQLRIKYIIDYESKYKIHSYDKIIDSKCNKKRPDIVIDAGTHFIVIEIDEMQHSNKSYTPECEEKRYVEILQALGLPAIFIRYNPDKYKPIDEQKMLTNINREKLLLKYLDKCINALPKDEKENLRILHLFYDGFDVSKEQLLEIPKLEYVFRKNS